MEVTNRVVNGEAIATLPLTTQLVTGGGELKHLAVLVIGVTGDAVEGWDAVITVAVGGGFRPMLLTTGAWQHRRGVCIHVNAGFAGGVRDTVDEAGHAVERGRDDECTTATGQTPHGWTPKDGLQRKKV